MTHRRALLPIVLFTAVALLANRAEAQDAASKPPAQPQGATSNPPASKAPATALSRDSQAALRKLSGQIPTAKTLGDQASAVLVFPKIRKAGFVVGGQYGEGT